VKEGILTFGKQVIPSAVWLEECLNLIVAIARVWQLGDFTPAAPEHWCGRKETYGDGA
jgi:hypothetical protein